MTDDKLVCHECGRTFRGINARIGEEMCPQCGSIDIARVAPAAPAVPARPAAPDRHTPAPDPRAAPADEV